MKMVTISEVSKGFDLSTRTLRYYEQIGLINSKKTDGYAYRVYDEHALAALSQIMVLRKLRIPLKKIGTILQSRSIALFIQVLEQSIKEADQEMDALCAIKSVVKQLLNRLRSQDEGQQPHQLAEQVLTEAIATLSLTGISLKEEIPMFKQKKTGSVASAPKEVRFVQLPPMRTVAYSCVDAAPEEKALEPVMVWVRNENLLGTMRLFGFNTAPYPDENSAEYGFGFCATIPEGVPIPEPLYEHLLPGGLYAVSSSTEDIGRSWSELVDYIKNSDEYDCDDRPCLEEHFEGPDTQGYAISLLLAVKKKQ